MGVDPVRRAGQQRDQILALLELQAGHLVGQAHRDLVDLVGQRLVQHVEVEHIALLQLVQVREEPGPGKPSVRRKHRVAALAPDRKRSPLDMPAALGQGFLPHAMIDGQGDRNLRNLETAHNFISVRIQKLVVRMRQNVLLRLGKCILDVVLGMVLVVRLGLFPLRLDLRSVDLLDRLRVVRSQQRVAVLVPQIRDHRVEEHEQACHKDKGYEKVFHMVLRQLLKTCVLLPRPSTHRSRFCVVIMFPVPCLCHLIASSRPLCLCCMLLSSRRRLRFPQMTQAGHRNYSSVCFFPHRARRQVMAAGEWWEVLRASAGRATEVQSAVPAAEV